MDDDLHTTLTATIGAGVELRQIDSRETQVIVPFEFADGDGLVIRLRSLGDERWEWTDVGHTFMHLSYILDLDTLESGPRAETLTSVKRRFDIEDRDGELVRPSSSATLGEDLFRFSQALIEVADLRTHTRERVISTFRADLDSVLVERFGDRLEKEWHVADRDPENHYTVDYLINHLKRPIAVFAVPADQAALSANVTLLKLREWGVDVFASVVHENQTRLSDGVLARLTDAVDKQWSILVGNETDIGDYIAAEIARQEDAGGG